MEICVQCNGPRELYGTDRAYEIIKKAGFDAVDVGFDDMATMEQVKALQVDERWLRKGDDFDMNMFREFKEASRKYGLDNFQAHSPFPSLVFEGDEAYNDGLLEMLKKSIAACDYIDCRNLVIHPFYYSFEHAMDAETEKKVNIERFSMLIPTARKYGITILLENLFSKYNNKRYEACCSNIDTACWYIDELNRIAGQEMFGFCMDTGHLHLLGKDQYATMVKLGKRIKAFHVHDNDGNSDQHVAPYMGTIIWNRFIQGLHDIGFNSTLDFETFNVWTKMDPEVAENMMKVIAETGRMFARRAGLE
ncbi:MAG: sugar phosphate isomerase/epimerase [Spirochaetales bacterium]|nr:sugar phosphate isomerase/epimerase [Spirochaetales bacterium]